MSCLETCFERKQSGLISLLPWLPNAVPNAGVWQRGRSHLGAQQGSIRSVDPGIINRLAGNHIQPDTIHQIYDEMI